MFRFTIGVAGLATVLLIMPAGAQAQRIYIGPGGVGVGIGNVPRGYNYGYRNPAYNLYGRTPSRIYGYRNPGYNSYGLSPSRIYDYYGNRSYIPRSYRPYYYDNFSRGYSLRFGSGAAYPYWGPRTYWYGDRWWGWGIDLAPRYYYGYTPSYGYSVPSYDYNLDYEVAPRSAITAPAREELTQLGWNDLRRVIANGADMLRRELDEISTGNSWVNYLLLDQLNESIAGDRVGPPDAQASDKLRDVLARFNAVAENSEYDTISDMAGFITVRRAVEDYLISPEDRYRRVLASTAAALELSLDDVATAPRWQEYLGLDTLTGVHEDPVSRDALQQTLARFDATSENDEYRMISELAGFAATHLALDDYVQYLSGSADAPAEAAAQTSDPAAVPADDSEDLLPPPPEEADGETPADAVPQDAAAPGEAGGATPPPQPQPADEGAATRPPQ